jgi:hypothetical protein
MLFLHSHDSLEGLGNATLFRMPLTDKEREIALTVVRRFLNLRQPTPHKLLVRQFKDPSAIERLVSGVVLNTIGQPPQQQYLPRVLAFQYCGDADALQQARNAVTVVLHTLRNLFDVELEKETFTPADIVQHSERIYDLPRSSSKQR